MSPTDYLQVVRTTFQEYGHPEIAQGQMAYIAPLTRREALKWVQKNSEV